MSKPYVQCGKGEWYKYSVRTEHGSPVATCAYNFDDTYDERVEMARRITAALNATANLTIEQIEALEVKP